MSTLRIAQRLASHFLSETSAFALDFYQRKCDDFSIGSQCIPPDSRPRRFEPFPSGHKAKGTTSPWPAAEPIPESRFTRIGGELYRLRNRAVPCIRPREAASESLATAIDGGYQVELLKELATQAGICGQ